MSETGPKVLPLRRNEKWQRNGKADYARSVRKYNITPSAQTTFHVKNGKLYKHSNPPAAGFVPSEHPPPVVHLSGPHARPHLREMISTTAPTLASAPAPDPSLVGASAQPTSTPVEPEETEVPVSAIQNDLEFVVPITIGTPGVTVHLDFDTGSSDLWVWGPSIPAGTTTHVIYDPSSSTTGQLASGLYWNITYGDGSQAAGEVHHDTIRVGKVAVPIQGVQVATALSDTFTSEDGSDGVLGLAFPNMNTVKPTPLVTPVVNMIAEKLVVEPVFTVKLDKDGSKGFYTFGEIAPDADTGVKSTDIKYQPVITDHGFWEFPSPTISVGGQTTNREPGNTAIADTGTTIILLSDAACQLVYHHIPGAVLSADAGGWVVPNAASLPTVSFGFGTDGTEYTISGEDLKYTDMGDGTSYGSIQSRGQGTYDILGDVFLRRVYAVFDQTPEKPRIGFAQRALD